MKMNKWLLIFTAFAFGGLFVAFKTSIGNSEKNDDVSENQKKVLAAIGALIEKQHYNPKKIDDNFSKEVFKKYLEELDDDKIYFLQQDINELKKFETTIDDELHGSNIKFVPTVNAIYNNRLTQVVAIYKNILSKPFDFTIDEEYIADAKKLSFSANEQEREERWRKKLKFLTLERYADLLDAREKLTVDSLKKSNTELEKQARESVLKLMNRYFERLKPNNTEEKKFEIYVNAITNLMDPHSDYFAPIEKRAFDEQMSGKFFGIGAQLQEQDGVIKIASVMPGYPAWRSGEIEQNDIILKVAQATGDAVDITGYDVTDAVKLIRGNKGTEVKLTIKKQNGTIKIVTLMRDEIVQDESYVRSAIVHENGKKIGYIFLPDFYADFEDPKGARCSEDVAKEIIKLQAEHVQGLVIDLRNNGGGSLYEVVQMVGLFIKTGPVVQVKDKDGKIQVLSDNNPSVLYDGPIAVLVNGFSASASEIFAAAIQDYKRGVIIGTNSSTYGKGTVQRAIPLGRQLDYSSGRTEYGAVKLTFQKFYRINGGSTQLKGVQPDILIPDTYEYYKFREKDNENAMPWDEIEKASYNVLVNGSYLNSTAANEQRKIDESKIFSLIKNNSLWLYEKSDKPVSLNYEAYRSNQKLIKSTVAQTATLSKLNNAMEVTVTEADKKKYFANTDKAKGERYQQWLQNVKSDLYIATSTQTILNLLSQSTNLSFVN